MQISHARVIMLFAVGGVGVSLSLGAAQQPDLLERARALHRQVPLIDGHNDYPGEVRSKGQRDLAKLDITVPQPQIMTDIPRLRQGGVGGQFWSVFVSAALPPAEAVRTTLEQIDIVHRMVRRYPDVFELALTADDIERIHKSGKIASMIGMEGGHSIDSSLGTLRMMHRLGARYMTISYTTSTPWADPSAFEPPPHNGLTPFGEAVVREMNWLGMMVDLSHTAPETMEDALRVTAAPVIFSHSSARGVADHPRNVPDNILRLVRTNGGVVMVTFVPGFISPDGAKRAWARTAEQNRLRAQHPNDAAAASKALEAWDKANPEPKATLAQVADHIDHIRKVAGIDHVGIGGDFDGISSTPEGLEDVSKYPMLTAELLRRGYSDGDVKKVLGLNLLRVMRAVERVSGTQQKERQASPALIDQLDGPAAKSSR
jgi:membrane dipeptidase